MAAALRAMRPALEVNPPSGGDGATVVLALGVEGVGDAGVGDTGASLKTDVPQAASSSAHNAESCAAPWSVMVSARRRPLPVLVAAVTAGTVIDVRRPSSAVDASSAVASQVLLLLHFILSL